MRSEDRRAHLERLAPLQQARELRVLLLARLGLSLLLRLLHLLLLLLDPHALARDKVLQLVLQALVAVNSGRRLDRRRGGGGGRARPRGRRRLRDARRGRRGLGKATRPPGAGRRRGSDAAAVLRQAREGSLARAGRDVGAVAADDGTVAIFLVHRVGRLLAALFGHVRVVGEGARALEDLLLELGGACLARLEVRPGPVQLGRVNLVVVVCLEPKATLIGRKLVPALAASASAAAAATTAPARAAQVVFESALERVVTRRGAPARVVGRVASAPRLQLALLAQGAARDVRVGAERVAVGSAAGSAGGARRAVARAGRLLLARGSSASDKVECGVCGLEGEEVASGDEDRGLWRGRGRVVEVRGVTECEREVVAVGGGRCEDALDAHTVLDGCDHRVTL